MVTTGVLGAASLGLIAYTLYLIIWPLRWRLLLVWAVVEALFFVCVFLPRYERLSKQPQPHEPPGHDAMRCWRRFLRYATEVPGGMDHVAYSSGWFRGADPSQLKRGNLEEFVAYGFWYRSLQQMRDAGLGDVPGQMVDQLQAAWGCSLEPGYNTDVSFLGHLWEPLNASWRPLAFYLLTEGAGHGGRALLRRWGFRRHHHSGLAYFTLGLDKQHRQPAVPDRGSTSFTACLSIDTTSSIGSDLGSAASDGFMEQLSAAHAPHPAAAGGAAVLPERDQGGAAAAAPQQQQLEHQVAAGEAWEQQQAPAKFASRLSSVYEASVPDDADWTPFATSSSAAAAIDTTPNNSFSGPCCPQDASDTGAAAAVQDNGQRAMRSKGSNGLKSAALSAPVHGTDSECSSIHAAAAGDAARQGPDQGKPPVGRTVSAQPAPYRQAHPARLQQLAPRTSQLLSAGGCPLQQVLSGASGLAAPQPGLPVLFLHGVGGLPAYLSLVLQMVAGQHPIIAVEFKGVSLRLGKVMTADEVAAAVVGMLDELGVPRVCVMAHSYGTFIASLLVRHHPERLASLYLLDPVCIGMFMPYLLTNFLYHRLEWKGWSKAALLDMSKVAVRKLAANDLHLCATFSRRFYWTELNMWPEDLPPGSVVLLSGKDDLMDSGAVRGMLERAGHVQVIYKPELTHGAFLLVPEVKAAIMGQLKQLVASSGSAVAGLGHGLGSLLLSCAYISAGSSHSMTAGHGSRTGPAAAPGWRQLPALASVASGFLGRCKEGSQATAAAPMAPLAASAAAGDS